SSSLSSSTGSLIAPCIGPGLDAPRRLALVHFHIAYIDIRRAMSTFRQSLPLLTTACINRCATIGLSLLPMPLIDNLPSTGVSSTILGLVKVALVAGTLLGGVVADRVGMKKSILLSFLLAGIGLGCLPLGDSVVWIGFWAVVGQLGQAVFYSPARVMVVELVPP